VPDILLRNIDESVAERIKSIARERNWSINDVILHILKHSLGFGGDDMTHREIHDVATLTGTWDAGESAAFRTALEAFERIDGKPLFVETKPAQPPK
jgi:hypothetical protein